MREPQRHIWPWLANDDCMVVRSMASKSQSAKMTLGFFPPSSRLSFLKLGAANVLMRAPVAVPPVNEIIGTSGCVTSGSPTPGPVPWTMLRTPAGKPTSSRISLSR